MDRPSRVPLWKQRSPAVGHITNLPVCFAASTSSEDTRNALNALLYQTGTASQTFMLVLATNRAEDLDDAILDRMVSFTSNTSAMT